MQKSSQWNLLSNHASVLIVLSRNSNQPLRKVTQFIGITERAVQRIVADLEEAGYISRERKGRQNVYRIHDDCELNHPLLGNCSIGKLLQLFNEGVTIEGIEEDRLLGNWTVGEHGSEIK
ncbi:MAG TPA: ArsR family transcriptional regulator [Opitutae bacterium]|mgnify:CR=1 FL=1|nr:ArsR family transcriptional regulator [Opitutae bacterium]